MLRVKWDPTFYWKNSQQLLSTRSNLFSDFFFSQLFHISFTEVLILFNWGRKQPWLVLPDYIRLYWSEPDIWRIEPFLSITQGSGVHAVSQYLIVYSWVFVSIRILTTFTRHLHLIIWSSSLKWSSKTNCIIQWVLSMSVFQCRLFLCSQLSLSLVMSQWQYCWSSDIKLPCSVTSVVTSSPEYHHLSSYSTGHRTVCLICLSRKWTSKITPTLHNCSQS